MSFLSDCVAGEKRVSLRNNVMKQVVIEKSKHITIPIHQQVWLITERMAIQTSSLIMQDFDL
jgi:hypothetical protein